MQLQTCIMLADAHADVVFQMQMVTALMMGQRVLRWRRRVSGGSQATASWTVLEGSYSQL